MATASERSRNQETPALDGDSCGGCESLGPVTPTEDLFGDGQEAEAERQVRQRLADLDRGLQWTYWAALDQNPSTRPIK